MLRYCFGAFSFFLTCIGLFACGQYGEQDVEPPANLVEEAAMIDVLVGTHILEQQLNEERMPKGAKQDSFRVYQAELFGQVSIDSAQYYESYYYYSKKSEIMQRIMTAVTDSIGRLRDEKAPAKNTN